MLLPTRFFYTGIHVADLERSIAFYTRALGMKLLFRTYIKETGGKVAWLRSRGSQQILELNWYPRKYGYGAKSGLDHLAFEVKNVPAEYRKLTMEYNGAMKPFVEGNWILAYVKDPDGNWIELGQKFTRKKLKRRH